MLDASDTRSLALLYHLNSEPGPLELADQSFEARFDEPLGAPDGIPLPGAGAESPVARLIRERASCREYADRELGALELGEILAGTYGLTHTLSIRGLPEARARAVPSAGALYPLELYLALRRVAGFSDGLYHYNAREHALEPRRLGIGPADIRAAVLAAPLVENANALVFLTAVFDRTLHKYGARGYRYLLFEAGHAAQNLCLLAEERGLATLCVGGFSDVAVNRFLELDPRVEAVLYGVALGHAA